MKSIYQKTALIVVIGFVIQIFLVILFYNHVILNRVIYEINAQENSRQKVMDNAKTVVDKSKNNIIRLQTNLVSFSKTSNVSFIVRDTEGQEILRIPNNLNTSGKIQEQQYIRNEGRIAYIIYGYFPPKLKLKDNFNNNKDRIVMGALILFMAFSCDLLIYKSIASPIRNLSKAINEVNYGNTTTKIPYYSEDEFGDLCRSFENMGRRLKSSEENQQQLIQAMSHDIKTPLTSIIGYSKRLTQGKVREEKMSEYYDTIYRKATDLKYLLEELDDYASLNSSKKYNLVAHNVVEYYNKICDELSIEICQKECKFTYSNFENIDENTDIFFNVDDKKMRRVFSNIIENSIKYVSADCLICLRGYIHKKYAYFQICDNGNGVPEEQLDKIFEKFYRVETSRSREKGGTGLGLAICKDILLTHNGDIYGENIPNKGFAITFYIPILT